VDLDALAGEIAARHAGVTVAGSGRAVAANRELLDAAISNLVDNAIRHGAPPIELVLGGDATVATVEVVDHGPGISEGNAARIFERFFTTARAQGGTGLGLALARAVAEGLGGSIHVACEQGETRFVVRIPRGLPSAPAGG
jgi:signal transduction histidine kinase